MNKRKDIEKLISAVFILMIIIPAFLIGKRLIRYQMENDTLNEVSEIVAEYQLLNPKIKNEKIYSVDADMLIDIQALKEKNADTVGYIRVPGTEIAYPVLKTDDTTKYLKTDFLGKRSIYGSIFADPASYIDGTNLVLYGHNMKSGKMFGVLSSYLNDNFREEHSQIWLTTEDSIRIYQICGTYEISADNEILIKNLIPYEAAELTQLDILIREHGIMFCNSLEWGKRYITLATCEYSHRNGRLFVMGIQTDEISLK